MSSITSPGIPGPLSRTSIMLSVTVTSTCGAVSACSAASSALSTSSLTATCGHMLGWCPICAVSSRLVAKSSNREVVKVSGAKIRGGPRLLPFSPVCAPLQIGAAVR